MFRLNMLVIALFTSDVGFKHVSCMVFQFMLCHGTRIYFLRFSCSMELEITVTVALSLWFSVNFQALRKRRALQRLTRKRHMHFLRCKIFCFRQAPAAIYSACWAEFLLFQKDLRGFASSHYFGTHLLSASIHHFERVWFDHS